MTVPPCRLEFKVIYFRSYSIGQRRAGSGTRLPPPRARRSEIYLRMCSNPPPPRKAKATTNYRAPIVCLVTVPVSCLDTAAVPGERPSPGPSPRAPVVCLVTVPVPCSDTAVVPGGETPPGPHPRARPFVLGHIFCLVLGHSRRAGGGTPPRTPHLGHAPSCWDTDLFTYF